MQLKNVSTGEAVGRGVVYILTMYYLFIGIAYLTDIFMASIEMITSVKKQVRIKDEQGREQMVVVCVWNQTIANLSLIALGGSASEVFLAFIQIISNEYKAEELGPSESVASAAFNLMVIIGVHLLDSAQRQPPHPVPARLPRGLILGRFRLRVAFHHHVGHFTGRDRSVGGVAYSQFQSVGRLVRLYR